MLSSCSFLGKADLIFHPNWMKVGKEQCRSTTRKSPTIAARRDWALVVSTKMIPVASVGQIVEVTLDRQLTWIMYKGGGCRG